MTDLTELAEANAALKESEKRCRYLSQELLVAQENERRLIAQDIHDSLGASLSAIKLMVDGIRGEKEAEAKLEKAVNRVQSTIHECRRIQMALRPSLLDDFGFAAAMTGG